MLRGSSPEKRAGLSPRFIVAAAKAARLLGTELPRARSSRLGGIPTRRKLMTQQNNPGGQQGGQGGQGGQQGGQGGPNQQPGQQTPKPGQGGQQGGQGGQPGGGQKT